MAAPFYEKPAFKTLQAEWDEKLKQSGFQDIETRDGEEGRLKAWHNSYFITRHHPAKFQATETYYREAGAMLHAHPFRSKVERRVWELHSEGAGLRLIAESVGIKVWEARRIVLTLSGVVRENCLE